MSSPLLGLDIGLKRTGVALSPNGHDVQPLETISWELPHIHSLKGKVGELIRKHEVTTLVIGVPLSQDGSETSQSLRSSRITSRLEEELQASFPELTIIKVNEFASTIDGRANYPHLDRDAAAACSILTSYLETTSYE